MLRRVFGSADKFGHPTIGTDATLVESLEDVVGDDGKYESGMRAGVITSEATRTAVVFCRGTVDGYDVQVSWEAEVRSAWAQALAYLKGPARCQRNVNI